MTQQMTTSGRGSWLACTSQAAVRSTRLQALWSFLQAIRPAVDYFFGIITLVHVTTRLMSAQGNDSFDLQSMSLLPHYLCLWSSPITASPYMLSGR